MDTFKNMNISDNFINEELSCQTKHMNTVSIGQYNLH